MAEAGRLDLWLFHARAIKTRAAAQEAIAGGAVRLNRVKVTKPGHAVRPGDTITLAIHGRVRVLKIVALGNRRGPAAEAQRLYEEMTDQPGQKVAVQDGPLC